MREDFIIPREQDASFWIVKQLDSYIQKTRDPAVTLLRPKLSQQRKIMKTLTISCQDVRDSLHVWIYPIYAVESNKFTSHHRFVQGAQRDISNKN